MKEIRILVYGTIAWATYVALVWRSGLRSRVALKVKQTHYIAWSGPEGSTKLRFPDFMTTAPNGGKVVRVTHRPPLHPGNIPGTHFC